MTGDPIIPGSRGILVLGLAISSLLGVGARADGSQAAGPPDPAAAPAPALNAPGADSAGFPDPSQWRVPAQATGIEQWPGGVFSAGRRGLHVRLSGRGHASLLRRAVRLRDPAHPGSP